MCEEEQHPQLTIASFEGTTQQRFWMVDEAKLLSLRTQANTESSEAVARSSSYSAEASADAAAAATAGSSVVEPSPGKKARTHIETLTVPEDLSLQEYYIRGMLKFSTDLKFPDCVESTAVAFYRRFFLSCSSMDYHPKDVMITAMWLACKVEHYPHRFLEVEKVTLEDKKPFRFDGKSFASLGGIDMETLLTIERVMLATLHYHLMVYHPYRPLRGFLAATANSFPPESREKLQKKASKAVREMVRTDAAFVFSPSELALYALKTAAEDMGVNFAAILDKLVADAAGREAFGKLGKEIQAMVDASKKAVKEQQKSEVQRINSKLESCRNPERNPKHPAYQRLEEERKRAKEQQRDEKNRIAQEQRNQKFNELLGLGEREGAS